MHLRRTLPSIFAIGVVAVGLAAAVAPAATASSHAAATAPATKSVVLRPVTSAGQPAKGYAISHTYKNSGTDCTGAAPSPGAVDPNIDYCAPSAAYAVACWKGAKAHSVLCLQDFTSHQVVRFTGAGFTNVSAPTAAQLTPLELVLGNGTKCSIRDGGAWGSLPHHPKLYGTYACGRASAVWAGFSTKRNGVNESKPSWTVRTGSFSGSGKLTTRHIKTAYFVGTPA